MKTSEYFTDKEAETTPEATPTTTKPHIESVSSSSSDECDSYICSCGCGCTWDYAGTWCPSCQTECAYNGSK